MLNVSLRTDTSGEPWLSQTLITDGAGNLLYRTIAYDDGTVRFNAYDATGASTQNILLDTEDRFGWSSLTYLFEDGEIVGRTTIYDTGMTMTNSYRDGALTGQTYGKGEGFVFVETSYSEDGILDGRQVLLEDGTMLDYSFDAAGRVVGMVQHDASGANDWTHIATHYDESGEITGREMVMDDGTTVVLAGAFDIV